MLEFGVPITAVAIVFTVTLWMRLLGAVANGWLADRVGRKAPLMISIAWYSVCNFIAGFSPTFWFLLLFRALLGIGMGAEWPAGAALAMETWPICSRGFMSGVLQGSWGLGFLLSSAAYGLLYDSIGWRGLLWIGILPALAIIYVRIFVKEPAVWVENRRRQRAEKREVRVPLLHIFKRGMIGNTLSACWWMGSGFVVYYSINALFATHLQQDLHLSPGLIATPIAIANLIGFIASSSWGWVADRIGRRWAMILPAIVVIAGAFMIQGAAGSGGMYGQMPSYLAERFPTEVRATASAFCYHQGAIWGGLVAPLLAYFATSWQLGFAIPMLVGTVVAAVSFIVSLLLGPETKGKALVSDLVVA